MGTALLGASSTEMMQDFPLHVLEELVCTVMRRDAAQRQLAFCEDRA
jgi:hypothetical protein